jgi:hypothetical protein
LTAETGPQAASSNPGGIPASGDAPAAPASPAVAPAGGLSIGIAQGVAPSPNGAQAVNPDQAVAQAGGTGLGDRGPSWPHRVGQGGDSDPAGMAATAHQGDDLALFDDGHDRSVARGMIEGLLAESLPIDLAVLDRAIADCLGEIDTIGENLADLLGSEGVWPWVAGTLAVTAAGALLRRWERRSRFHPMAIATGEGPPSSWFLEPIREG